MAELEIDRSYDVAVLRWSDGENRLRRSSVDAWNAALDELEGTDGPIAAVVVGEGKFFSNGLDLDWMGSEPEGRGFVRDVHLLLGRLLVFPGYLVGALNGHTFAAGAMVSLALDTRVMRSDRGFWCLPEADLALPLTDAMAACVTAKLPRTTAHDAIVTGRRYRAPDALSAGIVEHIEAESDVLPKAIELATAMAHKDRATLHSHKKWLYGEAAAQCGMRA